MVWQRIKNNIKNNLFSGLILIIPIFVTYLLLKAVFGFFDELILPIVQEYFEVQMPAGLGVILGLTLIYFIGMITKNYFATRIIVRGERLLHKIPIAKTIYSAVKQILVTLGGPDKSSFKKVLLVEYPRKGLYSVGFLNGEITTEGMDKPLLSVLVITSVNPTSGFLILVPPDQAIVTKLSVEEAMKMIVSGGIVLPEEITTENNPKISEITSN
jgi:uncharacterized membrane protein